MFLSFDVVSLYWNMPAMLSSVGVHPNEGSLFTTRSSISDEKGVRASGLFCILDERDGQIDVVENEVK
jgi:hypothetical protein